MKKQINEQFRRMQKLAGLITEGRDFDETDPHVNAFIKYSSWLKFIQHFKNELNEFPTKDNPKKFRIVAKDNPELIATFTYNPEALSQLMYPQDGKFETEFFEKWNWEYGVPKK